MRFLRGRGIIIIIAVVSALCVAAVGISISITVNMYKRYNKLVRVPINDFATGTPVNGKPKAALAKGLRIDGLNPISVYFNGQKIKDISAYASDKKDVLIAIDDLLLKLNIKFTFFSSDDIFKANINNKPLVISLGNNYFYYAGKKETLSTTPVAAEGHILVPSDLFSRINGIAADGYVDRKLVFLDYFPQYAQLGNLQFLRILDGKAAIGDISGKEDLWKRKLSDSSGDVLEFSPDMSKCLVKSGTRVYLIKLDGQKEPEPVNVSPDSHFSSDGLYLYWVDKHQKTSFLYNIDLKQKVELGNYYFRPKTSTSGQKFYNYGEALNYYYTGDGYRVISLSDAARNGNYTYIEKNGSVVIEGSVQFSPDLKRVLYYKKGTGYYTARSDGDGNVFLGQGLSANWVNNDSIFLQTAERGGYIFNRYGESQYQTDKNWKILGKAANGDILYTDGSWLYSKAFAPGSSGIMRASLHYGCRYIYALTGEGPYLAAADGKTDTVYLIKGKRTIQLGKTSLLLKDANEAEVFTNFMSSITLSPDNRTFVVLQKQWGFYTLNLIDTKTLKKKKLVLNSDSSHEVYSAPFQFKWLANDRLLLYTSLGGWVVDNEKNINVFTWREKTGSNLEILMH